MSEAAGLCSLARTYPTTGRAAGGTPEGRRGERRSYLVDPLEICQGGCGEVQFGFTLLACPGLMEYGSRRHVRICIPISIMKEATRGEIFDEKYRVVAGGESVV